MYTFGFRAAAAVWATLCVTAQDVTSTPSSHVWTGVHKQYSGDLGMESCYDERPDTLITVTRAEFQESTDCIIFTSSFDGTQTYTRQCYSATTDSCYTIQIHGHSCTTAQCSESTPLYIIGFSSTLNFSKYFQSSCIEGNVIITLPGADVPVTQRLASWQDDVPYGLAHITKLAIPLNCQMDKTGTVSVGAIVGGENSAGTPFLDVVMVVAGAVASCSHFFFI